MSKGTKTANKHLIHEIELYLAFWSIATNNSTAVTRIKWYTR